MPTRRTQQRPKSRHPADSQPALMFSRKFSTSWAPPAWIRWDGNTLSQVGHSSGRWRQLPAAVQGSWLSLPHPSPTRPVANPSVSLATAAAAGGAGMGTARAAPPLGAASAAVVGVTADCAAVPAPAPPASGTPADTCWGVTPVASPESCCGGVAIARGLTSGALVPTEGWQAGGNQSAAVAAAAAPKLTQPALTVQRAGAVALVVPERLVVL